MLIHDMRIAAPLHVSVHNTRSGLVHVEEPQCLLEGFSQPALFTLTSWVLRKIKGGNRSRAIRIWYYASIPAHIWTHVRSGISDYGWGSICVGIPAHVWGGIRADVRARCTIRVVDNSIRTSAVGKWIQIGRPRTCFG
jgi:hypothetical protein